MASTTTVNVALPAAGVAGTDKANRGGKYGEQMGLLMGDSRFSVADEGSYFVLLNTTPGTGIATIAAGATYVATSPYLMLLNNASAGGKRVYIDYIKLICTVAGGSGTGLNYVIAVDNGLRGYTSGNGLGATVPLNVNMDSAVGTGTVVYGGALVVLGASSANRLLSHGTFKTGIVVVGDTYILTCGSAIGGVGSAVATINSMIFPSTPVIIGPQQTFLLHLWAPSQSGASNYEIEMGWWER